MPIFLSLFTSFILAFFLTLPMISLAKKINLVTDKKTRVHPAHTHSGLIPRGGGLP
jgi:UDP-GlcNAc:undecaprenyl-phosphate GlcNAc-1-phosphate transferase